MWNSDYLLLGATTLYHAIASRVEDRKPPPGQRIDVGGYCLHLYGAGEGKPTIVLDHSLGGIEGYFLVKSLAKLARTCIYDRAGYGWSDRSPHPRTSQQIVAELDTLLTKAGIEPPYILVGNSFGSYNMRLYAHQFPEKVVGMVLTDGLHESEMLKMPVALEALRYFFLSGFLMSVLGSASGIIRVLKLCRIFELLKPELRQFSPEVLYPVKRSFCRPQHWLTMSQEIFDLHRSGKEVKAANQLGALPIVSIKASSFFKPSLWTRAIPLAMANQLRDRMHDKLLELSSNCIQLQAERSGHFVWLDRPDVILAAVKVILETFER